MINGNSVNFQFGKESSWGTAVSATVKMEINSEALKPTYDKTEEGLLTGGIGGGKTETMAISTEGDFSTLAKPSTVGYLLKGVLGTESVAEHATLTGKHVHTFTPIGNAETDFLPSYTMIIDRKASVPSYIGTTFNAIQIQAEAGDRCSITISTVGKDESTGSVISNLTDAGSSEGSFKFHQGKAYLVYGDEASDTVELADITSVNFNYNNNCDNTIQTFGTGLYHKQPQPGQRECTMQLDLLFSSATESVRNNKFKTDAVIAAYVEFKDSSNNSLKIELPACQISEMDPATATGADTLKQSCTVKAIDNTTAFARITLVNAVEEEY